jgi:hypothetical protein
MLDSACWLSTLILAEHPTVKSGHVVVVGGRANYDSPAPDISQFSVSSGEFSHICSVTGESSASGDIVASWYNSVMVKLSPRF